jgi:hypothetical protein
MKMLMEEIADFENARRRLEEWRKRSSDAMRVAGHDAARQATGRSGAPPVPPPPPQQSSYQLCDRCGASSCGRREYAVTSDAMSLRVGFRCAVEAWLLQEQFADTPGEIHVGVVQ